MMTNITDGVTDWVSLLGHNELSNPLPDNVQFPISFKDFKYNSPPTGECDKKLIYDVSSLCQVTVDNIS